MKAIITQTTIRTGAKAAMLGLALISLANCGDSGDSTTPPGGSAALRGPIAFVNNTVDKSLTSVALNGDSGNVVLGTMAVAQFGDFMPGEVQFSDGEWGFVQLGARNAVATFDPLTGAIPVHTANLETGTRPIHIYRDTTDGAVIWSMNDGVSASGPTTGDDLINCVAPGTPGGGSVTVLRNSHVGPGAHPPSVLGTTCLLADGHKVAAFSSGTGIPKRVFVSSQTGGEIAVLDNDPVNTTTYRRLIRRIDLCTDIGQAALSPQGPSCNDESETLLTAAFSPNGSRPHGIRWSKLTQKVYNLQENYRTIVEIDPTAMAVTRTFNLAGLPYGGFGITPDGRFLLLRGVTAAPVPPATTPAGMKLGVLDLSGTTFVLTNFTIQELDGTSPGSFKFSPDGKRFYILAGNAATATKKDRLFAFDSSTLTANPLALGLLREISLVATGGHALDVLAQGAAGLGEAKYLVVTNSTDNSVSIISAADNIEKQKVAVGNMPSRVTIYYPGMVTVGNQATASLTSGTTTASLPLPERLDDDDMPE